VPVVEASRPAVVSEHAQRRLGRDLPEPTNDHTQKFAGRAVAPRVDRRAEVKELAADCRSESDKAAAVINSNVGADVRVLNLHGPASENHVTRERIAICGNTAAMPTTAPASCKSIKAGRSSEVIARTITPKLSRLRPRVTRSKTTVTHLSSTRPSSGIETARVPLSAGGRPAR